MELASLSKGENINEKVVITREDQSPTKYVSTIEEWIETFGSESNLQKDTFVDTDGVSRFVDNWRAVSVATQAGRTCEELTSTGCLTVPIKLSVPSKGTTGNDLQFVNFMLNFKAFWDYNENDNADELTDYSPLFRTYIELFFHKRTVQLMMVLSMYCFIVMVVSDTVYTIYPPITRAIDYFNFCLQVYVYFALVVLFKGSLFPKDTKTPGGQQQQPGSNNKESRGNYYRSKEALNWIFYLKEALHLSAKEIIRLSHKAVGGDQRQDREAQKQILFYETLNVGLKFLTKHSKHTGVKLDLNRPVYNNKLLLIFFGIPFYVLMVTFYSPFGSYQTYMSVCNLDGIDSVYCNNFRFVFLATLGYTLQMMVKILFISSVLLSLVGLCFGAEIGCALVDSWILRFGSLRTLKADTGAGAGARDLEEGGRRAERPATATSLSSPRQKATASPNAPTGVINALHSNAVSGPALGASAGAVPNNLNPVDTCHSRSPELYIYLQRDSYEHYLYVREFMAISSRAWSFTIIAFLFMALFFIVFFMYGAITNAAVTTALHWTYYALWVYIRLRLLSVFPIVSLARANAYVYALHELFLVAAPEDFAVIGGRDGWLEYLDKVPAMWTIYGFNITWDRLNGLLWTGLACIGAIGLSSIAVNT